MSIKKILSLVTHRTVLVALLLLLQAAFFVATILRFSEYFLYVYLFCVLLSLFAVLHIINKKSDPGYKIAWIVPILLVPMFGGLFYLLCGGNGLSQQARKKMEGMDRHMVNALAGMR